MGLFSKLKGVFFEEEEEEIEEEDERETRDRVAVAKKIETPEIKKVEPVINREEKVNIEEDEPEEEKKEKDIFPSFDDKDFEVEKTIELYEPVKEPEIEEKPVTVEEYHYEEIRYEEPIINEDDSKAYHGLYEGTKEREAKPTFTPSPIISPIFGILNTNYKKEEIMTKKEIRLSQTSNKKADLDTIREKAYGDLAGDISVSIEEGNESKDKEVETDTKEDLLYDLSEESPKVKVVTVGDAEEYYNDLGLEYNVDYKVDDEPPKRVKDDLEELKEDKEENKVNIEENEDEKNIFDLIDSMYEDKE